MMPPVPEPSYFAPGLAITSMLCIWLAGMDWRASARLAPNIVLGLPLMRKRIFGSPSNSTFPSMSTETEGTFFSTSSATPLCEVRSFATL